MSGVPVCFALRMTWAVAWRKATSAREVRGVSVVSGIRSIPPSGLDCLECLGLMDVNGPVGGAGDALRREP